MMHILIGKKQILLSALVVMLGLAVFVNWYFTGTDTKLDPEGASPKQEANRDSAGEIEYANADEADSFASVRLERTALRDESLEQLNSVLARSEQDSEAAVQAAAMINAISTAGQRESDIESMVSASLGGECVAVISGDTVEVVIGGEGLNDEAALKISDIVNTVCGGDYENVRICAAMG